VETDVFFAVLFGAACHAGWNAFLKIKLEPFSAMALIAFMSAIVVLPLVAYLPLPPLPAWPWLAASIVCHLGYFIGLTEAYRTGDMGQVYPIARGTAPLLTAVAGTMFIGELIALRGWIGIVMLVSGVFLLSLYGGRGLRFDRRAVAFALFTAVTICGYSIVDGSGARVSGNPHVYTTWLFLLDGLMMLIFALLRRGTAFFRDAAIYWKTGLIGGVLSLASYWIAIWAMTVAPIALVAALRETSVLFATAIAVVVLKEPLRPPRVIAALMIVTGLVLIRLQ
jgi:drug/metabolite transporter (DMT)-like permease